MTDDIRAAHQLRHTSTHHVLAVHLEKHMPKTVKMMVEQSSSSRLVVDWRLLQNTTRHHGCASTSTDIAAETC